MNWLEALQAMSEGKTVTNGYGVLYRIHNGALQSNLENCNCDWSRSSQFINDWIKHEYEIVVVEYPLSFIEAMNEIQKGNKVECEKNPGILVYLDKYDNVVCSTANGKQTASFDVYEVSARWRVVEEEEC